MEKITQETIEAVKEMKMLYDIGVEVEYLSWTYPLDEETIVKICTDPIWEKIDI